MSHLYLCSVSCCDVRDGPAGLFADRLFSAAEKVQQTGQGRAVQHHLHNGNALDQNPKEHAMSNNDLITPINITVQPQLNVTQQRDTLLKYSFIVINIGSVDKLVKLLL